MKRFWTEKVFCRFLNWIYPAWQNALKGKGPTVKVLDVGRQDGGQAVLTILVPDFNRRRVGGIWF